MGVAPLATGPLRRWDQNMTATLHRLPTVGLDPADTPPALVRVSPLLATLGAAALVAPAVAWLLGLAADLTQASSDLQVSDIPDDPTGGAVLVVLALLLCLVPFMIGRAVAAHSLRALVAAGLTTVAVGAGLIAQLLF